MEWLSKRLLPTAALALGFAGCAVFGTCGGAQTLVRDDFHLGAEGWQIYDYEGGLGGGNVFYPVTWESSGGIGSIPSAR